MSSKDYILMTGMGCLTILTVLFFGFIRPLAVKAQPVISSKTLSLGGTSTAYINGPEAAFWNPANLVISNRPQSFHLTIGGGALFFNPVIFNTSVGKQFSAFGASYAPYEPGSTAINNRQRQAILNNHYPNNERVSTHRQRADALLAGAVWQKESYVLAIALRARYGSTFTAGRGWYDQSFLSDGEEMVRDFSLTQRRKELYELAVGFAQELTYLNGLLPGSNKFYIGITPKLIASGSQLNARFSAKYIDTSNDTNPLFSSFVSEFNLQSSGSRSRVINDYQISRNPQLAIDSNLIQNYNFEPTGVGLGFDFGLSYVIQLQPNLDDPAGTEKAGKSLRMALSINDIGAIRYYKNPLEIESANDTARTAIQAPADQLFNGSGGQYVNHLHQADSLPNPLLNATEQSQNSYTALLPTSVNTGILLDLINVKFMADLALGLENTAFGSDNIIAHIGVEVRPFPSIPIRAGTTFAKEQPFQVGFGTGIEAAHWDFTFGTQLQFLPGAASVAFTGGAWGGLQFNF